LIEVNESNKDESKRKVKVEQPTIIDMLRIVTSSPIKEAIPGEGSEFTTSN